MSSGDASVLPKEQLEIRTQNGPFKRLRKRFESILSVPLEFQCDLFRWASEADVCDRATDIGKALDALTEVYCELLSQFARASDIRTRFLQAPTEYMVTPVYYCDRTLDGGVHCIATTRKNINKLYSELRYVQERCVQIRNAAQKMYREVEADARPDMIQFIEERKAKATVFRELSERIGSVLEGGDSLFRFLDRAWCEGSAFCEQIRRATVCLRAGAPQNEDVAIDKDGDGQAESRDVEMPASTPDEGLQVLGQQRQNSQPSRSQGEVPETPEAVRPLAHEAPVTQVSSPRKPRSLSLRKRSRELRQSGDGVPVARNLNREPAAADGAPSGEKSVKSLQGTGNVGRENRNGTVDDARVPAASEKSNPTDLPRLSQEEPIQKKRKLAGNEKDPNAQAKKAGPAAMTHRPCQGGDELAQSIAGSGKGGGPSTAINR